MKILFSFILSVTIFIYGIQLFTSSLENTYKLSIKSILEKYTKTSVKGIVLGTILSALCGSSSIIMVTTIGLVNSSILSFHSSLGIMMGANLGTCITSWITSIFNIKTTTSYFLNPSTYIPFILLLGLLFYLKNRIRKSNFFIGFGLFLLGLSMLQTSLLPIMKYAWFKKIILSFNNPIIGLLTGIIVTCLIQSSSATVAILQTISLNGTLNYLMTIPIIMGENIGSCLTSLVSSFNTKKNAKKVALSHLLYNVIGTIIFFLIFYIIYLLKLNFIEKEVNTYSIALIHTLFNFFSIIIFYPFLNLFEKLINLIIKE